MTTTVKIFYIQVFPDHIFWLDLGLDFCEDISSVDLNKFWYLKNIGK